LQQDDLLSISGGRLKEGARHRAPPKTEEPPGLRVRLRA
jgi:hypothetical protein